jgi:hypothetical protein
MSDPMQREIWMDGYRSTPRSRGGLTLTWLYVGRSPVWTQVSLAETRGLGNTYHSHITAKASDL